MTEETKAGLGKIKICSESVRGKTGDIPRRDHHAVGVRYMLYMHICREGLEGNTVTCLKLSWLLCFFLGGGYRAYFKPALYFFLYFLNIIKIYQS